MRFRVTCRAIGAAVVAMVLSAPTGPVVAQNAGRGGSAAPKEAAGPVPRTADGHPDLSGVWWPGQDVPVTTLKVGTVSEVPSGNPRQGPDTFAKLYQPGPAAKAKTLSEKDDPALRCIPSIVGPHVALVNNGLVGQIAQTPKFVIFLTETYHSFKIIPTDGRGHRDDVAPSYRGDSVGRWEGDTLVIDTTNFNGQNWVNDHGNVSFYSDALHIVERYRRLDAKRLEVSTTVEDPKMLTRPWVLTPEILQLAPFDQIMEVLCTNTESADLFEGAAKDNYGRK
jgi:hypothetical protein